MLGLKRITAMVLGLSSFLSAAAVSLEAYNLTDTARSFLETRAQNAVPGPPHFVVYSDKFVSGVRGAPAVSQIKGFNVFALSFFLTRGPFDKALEWTQLTDAQRASIKSQYAAAGVKLIVSVFGGTERPTSAGANAVTIANSVATYVKRYNLDGVDVDYEDLDAMNAGNGRAEQWLITFTRQLRTQLPQSTYILTHAPLAPWFSPGRFGGGGYLTVHKSVGSQIDWYNIQFYNQGVNEYTTCNNLLTTSSSQWPRTAIFQIAASGVPLSKLVIGKPATAADASNGFMSTSTLAQCVQQAKARGWNAGVMVWQYPNAAAAWIRAVRASAFPV